MNFLVWLAACSAEEPSTPTKPSDGPTGATDAALDCEVAPTWDTWAYGFFQTWCLPCHSVQVPEASRQGAPVGVDFDSYSSVQPWLVAIGAAVLDDARMPPAGGVSLTDLQALETWLACDAPGTDAALPVCDSPPRTEGDVTVLTTSEAATLCDGVDGLSISGHVEVGGGVELTCLCSADGDLYVSGIGDAVLPQLSAVGGDLRLGNGTGVVAPELSSIAGNVDWERIAVIKADLPQLDVIAGDVVVDGTALGEMGWSDLVDVGGFLHLADNASMTAVDFSRLRSAGGDILIGGNDALGSLEIDSLEQVGGSVEISRNLALVELSAFVLLEDVPGDVIVANNASLVELSGFTGAADISGHLLVEENPALLTIGGFQLTTSIGGDLTLRSNGALVSVAGFQNLTTLVGSLVVDTSPALVGLGPWPALQTIDGGISLTGPVPGDLSGLGLLERVGGTLEVRNNALWTTMGGLDNVSALGGLLLSSNPELTSFDALNGLEVAGPLRFVDLPKLALISGFSVLSSVGGDLEIAETGVVDLKGLSGVLAVDGNLIISENDLLTRLDDLGMLQLVVGDVQIVGNDALPTSAALALVANMTVVGNVQIEGNGPD